MANPDGAKVVRKEHEEDANMAMALRNDQEYSSDAEGHNVEDRSQLAAKNFKKKSCFEITSVKASEIKNDHDDNDSNDDMDESRAEDFSSSELLDVSKASTLADIERQDIGENSHSTPKKVTTNNVPPSNSSIVNENVKQAVPSNGILGRRTGNEPPHELLHQVSDSGKTTNGNQPSNGNPTSRFKVVKVPRIEPFTRGRWTCRDFETQPSAQTSADVVNRTEQQPQQNKDLNSGNSSAASSVHIVPGENPNTDNPLLGGENSITGTSEQSGNINSNAGLGRLKSRRSKSSITHEDQQGSLEDTIKETLNVGPEDTNLSEDGDGTSAGGAIDNKIEQAMDLVKSHLLFAVREEVEVLKVQIKELAEKNEQLQRENAMLRHGSASAAQGAPMAMPQQTIPQLSALPQGILQQQTTYPAAGAPQTLQPSAQHTLPPPQQGQLPMGIQTVPQQTAVQHPQGMPQQQATQLPQTVPQTAQHLQQQTLQQSIPLLQTTQQQHSIPITQHAGAPPQLQQVPTTHKGVPNQAVQLNQAQQSTQPPKT